MLLNRPPLVVCVTATLISMWEAEAPGEIINEMGKERVTGKREEVGAVHSSVVWYVCVCVCVCVSWGMLNVAHPIRKWHLLFSADGLWVWAKWREKGVATFIKRLLFTTQPAWIIKHAIGVAFVTNLFPNCHVLLHPANIQLSACKGAVQDFIRGDEPLTA